jgi:hypothetical protein
MEKIIAKRMALSTIPNAGTDTQPLIAALADHLLPIALPLASAAAGDSPV